MEHSPNDSFAQYRAEKEQLLSQLAECRRDLEAQAILSRQTSDSLAELQRDYGNLRLQKGGFGFKMLLFTGFCATLFGILVCYLFFRPRDQHAIAFRQFQKDTQFHVEYAIGQKQFVQAEEIMKTSLDKPEYKTIRPELETIYKIISASKRNCE